MGVNKDAENADGQKLRYPRSVFFIIVNEFCERFSYYGMKTVLTLYLRDILRFDEDQATVWYHAFTMLCYFTPVFGAILADTFLGKFKTILYLSILYACGNILLSVSSIPNTGIPQREISLLGLFIIAVGTGGIKPCVSAFGGDQFIRPQQDLQLEQFFSIFYFSINAGSLLSTWITPYLRSTVHCFGDQTCYPLAFGVPAVLFIVALVVFVAGKSKYIVRPPEGNIMVDFSKCVTHAIGKKITSKGEKREHWLDFAGDKFDKQLIEDIKQVFRVLVLYLPIPVFWALFDQQGSRWTFQATRMDGKIGAATILPDQMGIINPLFILALVPVFESLVYPCFRKCGLLTPLQRIGAGGVITGLAFVISGFVELSLETTYAKIPEEGFTQLNFINTLPCPVSLSYVYPSNQTTKLIELESHSFTFERDLEDKMIPVTARLANPLCGDVSFSATEWNGTIRGASAKAFSVIITGRNGKLEVVRMSKEEPLEKSSSGKPRLGFIFNLNDDSYNQGNITITSVTDPSLKKSFSFNTTSLTTTLDRLVSTEHQDIPLGTYQLLIPHKDGKDNVDEPAGQNITVQQGGCYTILVQRPLNNKSNANEEDLIMLIEVTPPNSIHILWQVPQYFIMTVAEVMFSVTGLQFSFTQAPASMKSVMQAAWLLTVAFGNLIVLIVAEVNAIHRQSMEFFLFAGLMGIDMLLFIFLAVRYTYVAVEDVKKNDPPVQKSLKNDTEKKGYEGTDNKAFSDTTM